MSKGLKGEKNLKKMSIKVLESEKNRIYENALEIGRNVRAYFTDNIYEIAKIIDCRLPTENENKKKKTDASYEYYVHYIDFNRRMDQWVTRDQIKLDDVEIEEELRKRAQKEAEKEEPFTNDEHEGLDQSCIQSHEEATKFKTIEEIEMGQFRCETWYFSPYPEGYHNRKLIYLCEFCFNFYIDSSELKKHYTICKLKYPPGNEIYRDEKISVFEVDGKKEPIYCENLCYMAKLFLDHKTLQWDVEPFLFYILTEYDQFGYHFVGYFSKEKESVQGYNVACILTMPFHQRKGYGKFLISFSYLLSQKEGKIATPERPLSDLGKIKFNKGFASYFSYWTQELIKVLIEYQDPTISINKLAEITSIKQSDISKVLEDLSIIRYHQGQHIIVVDKKILDELYKKAGRPGHPLYQEKLLWTPYRLKYDF